MSSEATRAGVEAPPSASLGGLLTLWSSSVGKKVVMAATGVLLVGFVIVHMLGNLKIFKGEEAYNAYAVWLREMGGPLLPHEQALWIARIVLLAAVLLHITAAWQLARLSWAARPIGYVEKQALQATYAARTMRWGGVILLLFVVYHILHFTLGAVGYAPGDFRPLSVYRNVVVGFSAPAVSTFYIVAQLALGFHMHHGIWSMVQTMGVVTARTDRLYRAASAVVTWIVVAGNISIPVAVLTGWVR